VSSAGFYFEANGDLAERVEPAFGPQSDAYVQRCTLEMFKQVCHRIDERETFTLGEVAPHGRDVPNSQAALALRFLAAYGLIEKVHPSRNRRTEESIFLSAMTYWTALREKAETWRAEFAAEMAAESNDPKNKENVMTLPNLSDLLGHATQEETAELLQRCMQELPDDMLIEALEKSLPADVREELAARWSP
jgi:hypothetical protein